jgi:hypothetical protein
LYPQKTAGYLYNVNNAGLIRILGRFAMANAQAVRSRVKQNSQILDILSTQDLIKAWQKKTGKDIAQEIGQAARWGANYAAAALDTATAVKMMSDLGVTGKVVLKSVKNKQYVIFKGRPGTRSIFTGTRYLATNPKVVDMAVGRIGTNRAILSGARLTIFLVVPLNIVNHILSDQQTMSQLIGKTATDLVKVGVSTALAALGAATAAALTTLAAGPLVVAIAVGVASALALDALDKQFGVTDALVKALDKAYDNTFGEFGRQLNQVERHLEWQIMNGLPVGRGIFY